MRLDCSVADLSSPSRTVVEHDSVNTLVLLHDRLTLNSENLKANLQQDPEVENSSSNNRLTEDSGAKVAKEETFEVDTSDDEQGGASTGYSSSSDESYPASPVSKAITPAFINTTAFQFEHCLYFYRAPYHYCWGVCVGSQSESRVCRVHLGQDGSPVLEICDIISTTGSGASSRWNGLHFHHPNLFERKIYEPTGIVDMYQTLPAYPEYQDLVAHYPIPNAGGITNTDVPLQAIEPLHLGDIALPDNIPQQFFGVPDEPNQAPHQGNFNMHAQEAPGVNAGNSAFSLSIGNGAKYITLADRNMVTIAAIEEFVDGNLSHNRQRELIMCHVCTGPKRDMPRPDNRPYALKEHLKTHYFKVRCMWCSQAYSNKANLIKNHSNCPNAPAGITTETDRYTYVPRT